VPAEVLVDECEHRRQVFHPRDDAVVELADAGEFD
jgi:hypothetical protein